MASPDSGTGNILSLTEVPAQAQQACLHCSRLKRKCQRQLPACSLCIRLNKRCVYPDGRKPYGLGRSSPSGSGQDLVITPETAESSAGAAFPSAFFLDREVFSAVSRNAMDGNYPVPLYVSQLLGTDSSIICESFFNSINTWLPFISRKRLEHSLQSTRPTEATGISLLLLCMKLITQSPQHDQALPSDSVLYKAIKTYLSTLEGNLPTDLRVLQSLILIALYEMGHGVFPGAYLTMGRAARLGILRGTHDRKNATQLFVGPSTYTLWEEERRTWWATLILERYINIGPKGLPLATPEPSRGELLPCSDEVWSRGNIGTNPALYINSFTSGSDIGLFAKTCQSAHMLGRLLQHRDTRQDNSDRKHLLNEALQLHTALLALDTYLCRPVNDTGVEQAPVVDIAICMSARFVLYHLYACNEPNVQDERHEEESMLQMICIEGVKECLSIKLPWMARHVLQEATRYPERINPLVIQCLYDGASECQWLVQEGDEGFEGGKETLNLLVEALTSLSQRWVVARQYLDLLESQDAKTW